ncbi:MAG: hypothetical protein IPJ65_25365 [Archangiaceae bacterium]|nr:hypothetical protein [Archangiaceae bacterium]
MRRALLFLALLTACAKHPQTPECAAYISCTEAIDPTTYRSANGLYGPNGTCWVTNDQTADTCTTVCTRERENLFNDGGSVFPQCAAPAPGS